MDIVLSVFLIIFFLPLFCIICLVVIVYSFGEKGVGQQKRKSRIVIAQERIGLRGVPFTMYKIRTMRHDASLYDVSPKHSGDDRITGLGMFLRATSLDELPQFWNVLKGDMSLVGPRPEMPFLVATYSAHERRRLDVLPGLTGLWQVSGRKDIPLRENLSLDLYYVEHMSLWLDIKILCKTVVAVLRAKGAY